jgi:two-component system, NtrC family, sensor kinase
MKKTTVISLFFMMSISAICQYIPDVNSMQSDWKKSLQKQLSTAKTDTVFVMALSGMASYYKFNNTDSALYYGYKALNLAQKINFPEGEANALFELGIAYANLGNFTKAVQLVLKSEKLADKNNLKYIKAECLFSMGNLYYQIKDYRKALYYQKKSNALFNLLDVFQSKQYYVVTLSSIGLTYKDSDILDSAFYYYHLAEDMIKDSVKANWVNNFVFLNLGNIYQQTGNKKIANSYFHRSISNAWSNHFLFEPLIALAETHYQNNDLDSCKHYAEISLNIARSSKFYPDIIRASNLCAKIYAKSDWKKAYEFANQAVEYQDSLNSVSNIASLETAIEYDEQERLFELESAKSEFRSRIRMNIFLGSSFTLIVIAIFLFIIYRRKQKAKQNIENAYNQLKSTQAQLIQSEKMASLGELTAGIAHEIQNPLNFVNNFSDLNKELIDELKEELIVGNRHSAEELANDIRENEEKINHHGKRADAIVKGMLQHSRTSNGQKEPTDINALADEYLRLSFHGLRAKDKSFNAEFKTDFDPNLPKINVIPQDIGRVLLNLINNAFYAVSEKSKLQATSYKPQVIVSTKKVNTKIEICVTDNGPGIPSEIKDKIFQPFFTTKPTGQGTGLGLSLSYDIVKAHGGELKVDSEEGVGTVFNIVLKLKD